jgi:RHS repeat-associated protein
MDDKQRITLVETLTQGNDGPPPQLTRYQFGNHLGSASLELDDKGGVISYEEYTPYGSTSYQAVDQSIEAAAKRYRYTGKERDEETGFAYHGARYYAVWLGRWASCDTNYSDNNFDLYVYAENKPVHLIDPDGHAGVKFSFDGDDTNIGDATKEMAERMSRELSKQFGIATEIKPITVKEMRAGCYSGVPGRTFTEKTVGYELVLSNDTEKQAAAEKHWADQLQNRQDLTRKTVDKGTDPAPISRELIAKMTKTRDFIRDYLQQDHSVDMQTGGNVALGAFWTNESRTSMKGNPYTWYVKEGDKWVDPMEYGSDAANPALREREKSRVALAWGPTMLFIHEMEHSVGRTIKGDKLTGIAGYEEHAVMLDVDEYAGTHPDIAIRGQYGVGSEKYVITAETLPDSADKRPSISPPSNHAWIRWPSQTQLNTGRR